MAAAEAGSEEALSSAAVVLWQDRRPVRRRQDGEDVPHAGLATRESYFLVIPTLSEYTAANCLSTSL